MRSIFESDQQFSKKNQSSLLINNSRRASQGKPFNSIEFDQNSKEPNESKNPNHQDRVNKNAHRLESMNQGAINPVQFYLQSATDMFLDDEDMEARR